MRSSNLTGDTPCSRQFFRIVPLRYGEGLKVSILRIVDEASKVVGGRGHPVLSCGSGVGRWKNGVHQ
ncbi:MAG: hypothetical protein ABGY41_05830 [Candidatus Poribacteria bacterium]